MFIYLVKRGIQYCRLRSQCSIWTIINTSKYSSQAVLQLRQQQNNAQVKSAGYKPVIVNIIINKLDGKSQEGSH